VAAHHDLAFATASGRAIFSRLSAAGSMAVYTVLVDDDKHIGDSVPERFAGLVDDLLLTPLRPIEVLGKIKARPASGTTARGGFGHSDLRPIENLEEDCARRAPFSVPSSPKSSLFMGQVAIKLERPQRGGLLDFPSSSRNKPMSWVL